MLYNWAIHIGRLDDGMQRLGVCATIVMQYCALSSTRSQSGNIESSFACPHSSRLHLHTSKYDAYLQQHRVNGPVGWAQLSNCLKDAPKIDSVERV
jgi:hypothetical protein